jgi:formylglycine-generating enzyme required for sulfatase activity
MKMLAMPTRYYRLACKHGWREGGCYPEKDAKNDQDLVVINGKVNHVFKEKINAYSIMPRVVTNGQFEAFIKASGYLPRCTNNFLKHWKGATCPDSMKSKPVVYVSLEDARAYSEWAGLCLPTEWEWQAAAEKYGEKFITNEVWEWNESERNDGYNRFVNLRGGCSALKMHSSWWYFSGNYGGPQKTDSHCKYFLIYPGLDRSPTIGFRCVMVK